ncbi:MAG TPA: RNA 2',3'-cyclic phosphodiesterase [Candidatus Limnocylindrales bacterium]|nr:RNA 2',3'-cyclic phosphodiesterase [Candidatus Limnocylindrales bacterium]
MAERRPTHGHRNRFVPVEDDPARPRLFFAVPIPDPAREQVAALMGTVQSSVGDGSAKIRWVRVEGLHLTLRFLGPTPVERIPELEAALTRVAARTAPFPVTIAGAGAFPGPLHPRTLWLRIEVGADRLAELAAELGAAAAADGSQLETRPFAPHLTIARTDGLRSAPEAARALISAAETLEAPFAADRVVLYRSLLGHGPARYESLAETALEG